MAQLLLLRGAMGAGKSTVAVAMRELMPEAAFIEIDDIKVEIHGTPTKCGPEKVFREAGMRARKAIESGSDAIVIEPLCIQEHIRLVLDAAGVSGDTSHVPSVWLHCTLKTARERKGDQFHDDIIRHQHARYATRYKIDGEAVIETDGLSKTEVAQQVWQHFHQHLNANQSRIPAFGEKEH